MSFGTLKKQSILLAGLVWLGTSFWILLLEFFSDIYLLNLMTLSINGAILYLFLLYIPIFLGYWKFRAFLELNRGLLFSIGAIGYMSFYFSSPFLRGFLLGIGTTALLTGFIIYWKDKPTIRKIALEGFLLGLLVSLLLKMAWFSRSILWYSWWTVLIGIILLSFSSYIVQVFRGELIAHVEKVSKTSPWLLGINFGLLLFITHWLFSGYGVIPRWENLNPEKHGILVIVCLGLGIISIAFLNNSNEKSEIIHFSKYINNSTVLISFSVILLLAGAVFSYNYGIMGEIGGLIIAFLLPILWFYTINMFDYFSYGKSVFLGITVYILMAVFSIFTVVFDYVPGGYIFRGAEEILLMISLLVLTVFLGFLMDKIKITQDNEKNNGLKRFVLVFLIFILIFTPVVFTGRTLLVSKNNASINGPIIALQYNIQQGFDAKGNINFEEVAEVIRNIHATIVGLQETETMRISTGNKDIAWWLGETLKMYVFEGPSPKDSTFGNAILSLYPFISTEAIILPSRGEYAVLLVAKVIVNGTVINVLSAHFGGYEDDRQAQAEKTAEIIKSLNGPIILLGDFNSVPGSIQINTILRSGVSDAFYAIHGDNYVPTTVSGTNTIDFIFYSGVSVVSCDVLTWTTASDHYPVLGVFTL